MANINLLPWREEQRKEKTRQFASMMGFSVVLTLCLVGLVFVTINGQIGHQQVRNKVLTDEIARLDIALIEIAGLEETKQKLLSRMDIIQSLQQKRPQIVHLFDELVRTLPDGVHLDRITQTGPRLKIEGVAQSSTRVSAYMRNIDGSDWMGDPVLDRVETVEEGRSRSSEFTVFANQVSRATPTDEEGLE